MAAVAALSAQANESLNVAATAVPHAEILEFVKPQLAEQGVDLNIKVFTDYIQPNVQVAQKNMDANFFQHQPYLDEFNKGKGTDLVAVTGVHLEPLGAYSSKIKQLDELGWKLEGETRKKDGKELVVRYVIPTPNAVSDQIAKLVQSQLKEVGAKIDIQPDSVMES